MKKAITLFVIGIVLSVLAGCDLLNPEDSQNIVIQGSLIGWTGGGNKTLAFGIEDSLSGQLFTLGITQINEDGSFQFDSLDTPPDNLLEPVDEGPNSEQSCKGNFEINNPNALIAEGKFYIMENGEIVGRVYSGEFEPDENYPPANQTSVVYIYSQEIVTVTGQNNCVTDFGKMEKLSADISLNPGWNSVVIETLSETDNDIEVSYKSNESVLINWQFYLGDSPDNNIDIEGEYNFNFEGQIGSWNLGPDKILQFGSYNYITDKFEIYAESQITADGQFNFDKAINPSLELLIPFSNGLGQPENCSVSLNTDNQNSKGAKGILMIYDPLKNEQIGEVAYGIDNFNDGVQEPGEFESVFIFASEGVNVNGNITCDTDFASFTTESVNINFTAYKGWNLLIRRVTNTDGNIIFDELINSDLADGHWFVYNKYNEPHDFEGTYPIDISGQIENWDLGEGKYVQFGEYNFETGGFEEYAKSPISSDGSFAITEAVNPPKNFLFPASDGFTNITECSSDVTVSNQNAFGAYGHLLIFDSQTQQVFGNLINSLDVNQNGLPDAGDFSLEYYFVTDGISIAGIAACEHSDQNNNTIHEDYEFNMNFGKGWNIATRKIKLIDTNNVSFEITTDNMQNGNWYFNREGN